MQNTTSTTTTHRHGQTDVRVTVHPATPHWAERAEVAVWTEERTITIEVYGPAVKFGTLQPAGINWPSCGTQSAEVTAHFAAALAVAAEVALTLQPAKGA